MASIDIYDPKSGQVHEIPYEHVQDALTAGGEFADEYQMKKVQEIQSGTYEEGESYLPEIKTNPFLPPEEQPKQEKQQSDRTGFRGIGLDVIDKLSNALKNGRTFLHDLPQEAEGASYQFGENPNRAWGQIGASAAETGKGLINAPKAAGGYLAEKGLGNELFNQIQQQLAELVPGIPEDTGVEKALGLEEKEVGDKLLRSLPNALVAGGAAKTLVKEGAKAIKGPDLKTVIKDTQKVVNEKDALIGDVFENIENAVEKKSIQTVPIDTTILDKAESYLPKTKANKMLLDKARTGDYKALRKLQADLRVKGEKGLSSDLKAENDVGEEILDVRDDVNQSIESHLVDSGEEALANALSKARTDYRDLKQTYFSTPALAKVFGKSQKVPKSPLLLLEEDSVEMNKFMSQHPEVKDALAKALKHGKLKKVGKYVAGVLGIGTAGEFAREKIFGR